MCLYSKLQAWCLGNMSIQWIWYQGRTHAVTSTSHCNWLLHITISIEATTWWTTCLHFNRSTVLINSFYCKWCHQQFITWLANYNSTNAVIAFGLSAAGLHAYGMVYRTIFLLVGVSCNIWLQKFHKRL